MNAHQFAKLTQRQQLEHITRAKRVMAGEKRYYDATRPRCFYFPKLNGVRVGNRHQTKKAALEEGRRLLAKYKAEARELGIPLK